MDWFTGSIPEAILAAKERNGIFVVFVHDESDSSKTARDNLTSERISSILTSSRFVCIQLENGSQEAKQFAQIYPLIVVPSLFLIKGQTGIPVEVVGGNISEKALLEKLQPLFDSSECESKAASSNADEREVSPSLDSAQAASIPKDAPRTEVEGSIKEMKDENPSAAALPADASEEPKKEEIVEEEDAAASSVQSSISERIDRAKVLLDEKQIDKEIEKQEDDKRKEMERRSQGQGMAVSKQKREEAEFKEFAMQRKREIQEDKIHRERVKAQIAADRIEREQREALFKDPASVVPAPPTQQQPSQPFNTSDARIKFRFPDSSSITGRFSRDDTLATMRDYVRENATIHLNNFTLVSILHHRPFTDDQLNNTLQDLGLTPSAIVNVNPSSESGRGWRVIPSGGSFYGTFWTLLSPIVIVLNFIKRFFGLGSPPSRSEQESSSTQDEASTSSKRLKTEGSYTTRNRPTTASGSRIEGNVHRLNRADDDEDDENNTWNGNSTQQM